MNARFTRRQFGQVALAAPAAAFLGARRSWGSTPSPMDSRINGVRIGAITYSFRAITDASAIVSAMAKMGLGEAELMANHAEMLAGAPTGRGAAETLEAWRRSATSETWQKVRQTFNAAGIQVRLLCYNMNVKTTTDELIEYGFQMAKGLGVDAITTSTQVSMAKRVAPFADKHQMRVGFHGHANVDNPDEVATPASFATCLSYSKYHGINLDIGHFTAANFDAVAFLSEHHAQITNLHLKDRKRNGGANVPWGEGDTPIKQVLQLMRREKWDIPADIEFEYPGDPLAEVPRCLQFAREALA
jgi:sugar phosphate isomerase/epimerase